MTRYSSATLLAVAAVGCGATVPSPVDPPAAPQQRYVFIENTDRYVGVLRGDAHLVGKLDKNGDFTHEIKLKAGQGSSAGIPAHVILNGGPAPKVYELRSGVLVPGELRKGGNFVPEVGGKIIAFADYTYTPDATRIWNLPGGFEPEKRVGAKK